MRNDEQLIRPPQLSHERGDFWQTIIRGESLTMKCKRYSVEQIEAAVQQHDMGLPAEDIARKLGIAEQTFYRWMKQYGGLETTAVRGLTQLREENATLKNLTPLQYKAQWHTQRSENR